tara:strand:+ start:216 stop:398 length:183 start_codon:yes stop_codon:yes gene_type:complete
MKRYQIRWNQKITKLSIPIEALNKEQAKNKWMELKCPITLEDIAGEEWTVEEIKEERLDE